MHFRYREVIRHSQLFCETLQQVTIADHRLLESIHHFRPDQVLGRNHIVQIEPERILQNMPLGLPILLSNRNKFIVELKSNPEVKACPPRPQKRAPLRSTPSSTRN